MSLKELTNNTNSEEFLIELKALLEKYNATIWADMDGDTHGVSSFVVVDIKQKEIFRIHQELEARDIRF